MPQLAIELPERYVLAMLDGNMLFVPQEDIASVEILMDMNPNNNDEQVAVGYFGAGHQYPIYCLSGHLHLLTEQPNSREFFLMLKDAEQPIGFTCDSVETVHVSQVDMTVQSLPQIMNTEDTPIAELALYQEKLGMVCHGKELLRYMRQQAEHVLLEATDGS